MTAAAGSSSCAVTLFGISYGGLQDLTRVMAFDVVRRPQYGLASAVWNVGFDLGMALGSVLGWVDVRADFPAGLLVAAAIALLTLPLAIRRRLRPAGGTRQPYRPRPGQAVATSRSAAGQTVQVDTSTYPPLVERAAFAVLVMAMPFAPAVVCVRIGLSLMPALLESTVSDVTRRRCMSSSRVTEDGFRSWRTRGSLGGVRTHVRLAWGA